MGWVVGYWIYCSVFAWMVEASPLKNRSKKLITKAINMMKITYFTRGFIITDYYADNEFTVDDTRLILLAGQLQVCARGEHIPRV